ncbi:hypothetical protein PLESTM_000556300 [Pleodorina starrii]|nr:hypothetical protein PLESTM_000556300 [Pleodorina starrii]
MELQACSAASELARHARSSSEWPTVCGWVCRLSQRAAALHTRCGRADEAAAAAREGLAFAEANGLQQHRLVFLLLLLQLALGRWDHATADNVLASLRSALNEAAAAVAAGGAAAGAAAGLDAYSYPYMLLHVNLLQVLYLLRLGKVTEVVKADPQQQPPPDPDGPDVPPPPVLHRLETTLAQIRAAEQQGGAAAAARLPYALPGLPSLEPLVCLVCATALRISGRPRLVDRYLQRGLACLAALLAAAGVDAGAEEGELPRQSLEGARAALQLQLLLLESRAQVALAKAELRAAREDVLACQQLQERFPGLLQGLLPGVHLLTGQYCVATGETAAAVAHFQVARLNAPSRPAAALASVLEAQAHLSTPQQQQPQQQEEGQQPQQPQQQPQQAMGDVARALAALGPFYVVSEAALGAAGGVAGGGGGGGDVSRLSGCLGNLEDAACLLGSASCLVQQGQLGEANTLLSRALKIAFKRLGHTQLTCAILNQLAPIFLASEPPDTHSATEAAKSAVTLSGTAGDLWAAAQGKQLLSAIARLKGEDHRAEAEAAAAGRRQQRITAAAAEALADSGRHGYAACWGLQAVG